MATLVTTVPMVNGMVTLVTTLPVVITPYGTYGNSGNYDTYDMYSTHPFYQISADNAPLLQCR